jgi:hypothetical protein
MKYDAPVPGTPDQPSLAVAYIIQYFLGNVRELHKVVNVGAVNLFFAFIV